MAFRAETHGQRLAPPSIPSLFGLAPCGVCHALCITAQAVRSYRTFSPLPTSTQGLRNGLRLLRPRARFEQNGSHRSAHPQSNISGPAGLRLPGLRVRLKSGLAFAIHLCTAVYFLWHFPSSHFSVAPKRATEAPSRTLSGTLLYGVRTFLSSSRAAREIPAFAAGTATIRPDIHSHIIR